MQNLRYIDMIHILGLLKSFALMMQSKSGAFFQKGIELANKKLISHTGCPKNGKGSYSGEKIEIY